VNHKIIASLAGFFFVRALNIVRIISLTYQFNVLLMPNWPLSASGFGN